MEEVKSGGIAVLSFRAFNLFSSFTGDLLRGFSYMGFEGVIPDHPALHPWGTVIFMVYPLERDPGHLPSEPPCSGLSLPYEGLGALINGNWGPRVSFRTPSILGIKGSRLLSVHCFLGTKGGWGRLE